MGKNQKTKFTELLKKFSFVWVILCAAIVHFIVTEFDMDYSIESSSLFVLWVVSLLISCYLYSYFFDKKFREKWDFYDSGEFDLLIKGPSSNRVELERNGKISVATIDKVFVRYISAMPSRSCIYVVKYSFKRKGIVYTKTKKIIEQYYNFDPNPPKEGDLIEILYDESNPNNSIIFHEKADKTKWYQLQKKYKIKIIRNINNTK